MSMDLLDSAASISIAGDRLSATLRLHPGAEPSCCTPELLLALIDAKGIARATVDVAAIETLAAEHRADNSAERSAIIARGTPPKHGQSGRFELEPSLAEEVARAKGNAPPHGPEHAETTEDETPSVPEPASSDAPNTGDASEHVSFYEQSHYVIVKAGQTLGFVRAPVEGVDGIDVTGVSLAAKQGASFAFAEDASIELRSTGHVIALVEGRLDQTPRGVRVVRELIVDDSVDFSTGNIDFPGDALVRRGIKDCFKVAVGGNLRVQELVEAATIECGGDCTLDRGMTGRGKGELRVGGTLSATFLSDARVDVAKDLCVSGEIRASTIHVGRAIRSPRAAILGGVTHATLDVELAQLGGEGEVHTELFIGHAPALQELATRIGSLVPKIRAQAEHAQQAHSALAASAPRPTAQQKEQLLELQYAASNAQAKIPPLEAAIEELSRTASRHVAAPSATFHRMIFPKSVIVIGPWRIEVENPIKGPVRITMNQGAAPTLSSPASGTPRSWKGLARVAHDERFAALPSSFWSTPQPAAELPPAA
ncbi:MAG: FapA family protein [Phycisphaerales bacterium]|jgi:uncharacterized protein (DUF342 family)|nr:FapA family protein [Phycisphaerales bacterium]